MQADLTLGKIYVRMGEVKGRTADLSRSEDMKNIMPMSDSGSAKQYSSQSRAAALSRARLWSSLDTVVA